MPFFFFIFGFLVLILLGHFGSDVSLINFFSNAQVEQPLVIDAAFTNKSQLLAYRQNVENLHYNFKTFLKVSKMLEYDLTFQKPFINILFYKSDYWFYFINLINICPVQHIWVPSVNDVYIGSYTAFSPEAKLSFVKDILNKTHFIATDNYCYAPMSTIHHNPPFLSHGESNVYWLRNKARIFCLQYGSSDFYYNDSLKVASIVINQQAHIQAIKDIKTDNIRFRENCKSYLDQWSSKSKKLKRH